MNKNKDLVDLQRTELEMACERFKEALESSQRNKRSRSIIAPKGSTLYTVDRTVCKH